jgi:hypothetical protein
MKTFKAIFLICFIFLSAPKQTNASFISSMVSGFFSGVVDDATKNFFSKGEGMIDKAKTAFRESMDSLFDNKIRPIIYQIQSAVDRAMGQMDDLVNKTLDNLKKSINETVNNAAAKAISLVNYTTEQIKTRLIDEFFNQAKELENKIMGDLIMILNRVDETILKISCSLQAIEIKIREDLTKFLPTIPNPNDKCRISIDVKFPGHNLKNKALKDFESNELYELKKCYIVGSLTETTPIQSILMSYRDLEFLAAGMRCYSVSVGAIQNQKYYIREMAQCSMIIDTFEQFSFQVKMPHPSEQASLKDLEPKKIKYLQ